MSSVPFDPTFRKSPFSQISRSFLDDSTLPFTNVLPADTIELIFRKHNAIFGGEFFNTVFVLWAFLAQVLSDGKNRSCSAAVSRIATFCLALGQTPPDDDTEIIVALEANFPSTLSPTSSGSSRKTPKRFRRTFGSGKTNIMPSSSMASPQRCPTPRRINNAFRSIPNKLPVAAFRSCGFALCCRSPRQWSLTPRSTSTKARRPANPPCCEKCSTRLTPMTSPCSTGTAVRI